jgi:arylsulfatase A-like enzyme
MERREFLRWAGSGAAALALSRGTRAEEAGAPARKPNILFVLSDDQRHNTIHELGCAEIVTPNLDQLAQRGTAFTQAAIMGGNQGAVCVPSRAMILTGKTLFHTLGRIGDHTMLPQWFKEHGYTTFISGKWHNERGVVNRGFSAGSAIYFGGMGRAKQPGAEGEGVAIATQDYDPTGKYPPGRERDAEGDATDVIANAVVKFVNEAKGEQPFFIYMPTTAPHDPRIAPRKFRELYDPAKIPLPPNFLSEHPFDNGELRIRDENLAKFPRQPEEIRRHIADYYACISWLDHNIGRVFEALKKSGRWENTIVVFAGDNDLALGQHGLLGKQSVYEHSVRVPLVFAGPGVPAGKRTEALCYLFDIFPTLCDLAGLPKPEGLEGESLVPVMRETKAGVREELFFAYRNLHRAVKNRELKLIEYYVNGERRTQLFNLKDDPWETKDLSGDPNCADVLAKLRADLTAWQKKLDDPMLQAGGGGRSGAEKGKGRGKEP